MDWLISGEWFPGLIIRSVVAACMAWLGFRFASSLRGIWKSGVMALCVTGIVALPLFPLPLAEGNVASTAALLNFSVLRWLLVGFAIVWVSGIFWHLARRVAGNLWISEVSRTADTFRPPEAVKSALGEMPRGCRILISKRVAVPFACGYFRPRIVLPESARTWTDARLLQVLAHELHHHRAGDIFLQSLSHSVCLLFWWNPLVWHLSRLWQQEREFAADRAVLSVATPVTYAENLLELSELLCSPENLQKPALAAALYLTKPGNLEIRIRRLFHPRRNVSRLRVFASTVALAGLFAMMPACVSWIPVELAGSVPHAIEADLPVRLSADPFPGS